MRDKKDLAAATYAHTMRLSAQSLDYRANRLGKMGPASPVRRLDPVTLEVIVEDLPATDPAPRRRPTYKRAFRI